MADRLTEMDSPVLAECRRRQVVAWNRLRRSVYRLLASCGFSGGFHGLKIVGLLIGHWALSLNQAAKCGTADRERLRYCGLAKNAAQLFTLIGLANLLIAKRRLFALHAQGAS